MLVRDLHPAAHHLEQVRDDLAFEDLAVVSLQAVEDFTPHGHDPLELGVPAQLHRAQSRVALHNVELPAGNVLGAAVHELLHPVGDVHRPGQALALDGQAGLLPGLPAALAHQDLPGGLLHGLGVFQQENLQVFPEEIGHALLDKPVVHRLFGLVFIGGLGGEVVGDEDEGLLDVGPGDLGLVFVVLAVLLQPSVHGREEGRAHGLFRGASVLQPGGVVVVLDDVAGGAEAEGAGELHLVVGLVRPVPAHPLPGPELDGGVGVLPGQLGHVVGDAVFIGKDGLLKALLPLVLQPEDHPRVDHRLAVEDVGKKLYGDVGLGEDLQIGQPGDGGAGFLPVGGGDLHLPHQAALFKVEVVPLAVPADDHVHKPGGILGGAGPQAVEAQGVFIVVPGGVVVFAPGVELAKDQLPVEFSHLFVPVHRAAPAEVLHLDPAVPEPGDDDLLAVALPGLVDGVGEDFKDRVLAALQAVGAKNDPGPLPDPVGPFQHGDGIVAVFLLAFCHGCSPFV